MFLKNTKPTPSYYLQGIRLNDSKIIEQIYAEYLDRILRFILRNRGTAQDAEDVFMDAMESICRQVRKKGLSDLSCSFYTYLYEICKGLWYKQLRRQNRESEVTFEELMVFSGDMDPQEAIEETERHGLFWEKFRLLSPDCQKVLELSLIDELSGEEIAERMSYASEGYARKKKHECKEQLRKAIQADDRFDDLRLS
jgi:RNA polymerase sigma factor (sigma-70 family)